MPFTPIHLGPGAAFKAIGGKYFSFLIFGGSQALMDIEPLIGLIQGKDNLHGYTHTILGALLIGLVAAIIGRPISSFALKFLKISHHPFTWVASFTGAYIGTFSHIGFDAIMHSDMNPLWPITQGNSLLGIVSIDSLHILCLASGLFGVLMITGRYIFYGRAWQTVYGLFPQIVSKALPIPCRQCGCIRIFCL